MKKNNYVYPYQAALELATNKATINLLLGLSDNFRLINCKLQKLTEKLGFDEFIVFDTQSIIVAATNKNSIGTSISERIYANSTLKGEGVQTALYSLTTGQPNVITSFPVINGPPKNIIGGVGLITHLCQ